MRPFSFGRIRPCSNSTRRFGNTSARNRSASCRIPYGAGEKAKRVEFRFPDAMANQYLAYAALLMAGLDGIQSRIHPGEAMDKNLDDLPPA